MLIEETTLDREQQAGLRRLRRMLRKPKSRVYYTHIVLYAVGSLKFVRFEDDECRPILLYVWTDSRWSLTPEYN